MKILPISIQIWIRNPRAFSGVLASLAFHTLLTLSSSNHAPLSHHRCLVTLSPHNMQCHWSSQHYHWSDKAFYASLLALIMFIFEMLDRCRSKVATDQDDSPDGWHIHQSLWLMTLSNARRAASTLNSGSQCKPRWRRQLSNSLHVRDMREGNKQQKKVSEKGKLDALALKLLGQNWSHGSGEEILRAHGLGNGR